MYLDALPGLQIIGWFRRQSSHRTSKPRFVRFKHTTGTASGLAGNFGDQLACNLLEGGPRKKLDRMPSRLFSLANLSSI